MELGTYFFLFIKGRNNNKKRETVLTLKKKNAFLAIYQRTFWSKTRDNLIQWEKDKTITQNSWNFGKLKNVLPPFFNTKFSSSLCQVAFSKQAG